MSLPPDSLTPESLIPMAASLPRQAVAPDVVDRLRAAVSGRVAAPGDADWEMVRRPWNVAVEQHPAAVVEVADAEDVRRTVRAAVAEGLAVAAQPGGHGATLALDGTVVVRTGRLDEVRVDVEARVARVGAGVKWGALLAALEGTGLVGMCGSNPDVSVVGYLLGGGLSWLSRMHGFASSTLRAVELVDAQGAARRVTDASDPELMWALRGGGGDFGIVTAVEVDLVRGELYGGLLMFPVVDAPAVLRAFVEVTSRAPRELTLWASLMHVPPLPFVPEEVRGKSFAVVDVLYCGDADVAETLLAPIRAAGTVVHDTVGPVDPVRLGAMAEEPTDPTPAMEVATLLRDLDADAVDRLLAAVGDPARTPLMSIQLRHLGGALADPSRVPAVASQVEEPYLLFALGIPAVPELAAAIPHGFAALLDAVAAEATGRSTFTLGVAPDGLERVYAEGDLTRLRAVKAAVDPDSRVRSNRPLVTP